SGKMLEALIYHPLRVDIHSVPIPTPKENEVLTKVVVSGSNPKDWKRPFVNEQFNGTNQGDDIAGIVEAVGSAVTQFKPGDRVAGFHQMQAPGGSYAEYAISPEHTTFHIPANVSFEDAAAIPLAAMTAAVGLFVQLGLPEPWVAAAHPEKLPKGGLVVYGAASAVGAYAVQLAKRAGIHPIIAVAGRGMSFVEGFLDSSKGDVVIDYRKGDEAVVEGIKNAIPQGAELEYAYDAVSEAAKSSFGNICKVLAPNGQFTTVLPTKDDPSIPKSVKTPLTMVGSVFTKDKDFGYAWYRLFELGLKDGWFKPHPHEVIQGGLNGIEEGLRNLKEGKVSATKYVFRISETEGL
ncbi:NADPH2:quinone reductase, partial [Exophiala viscosa]